MELDVGLDSKFTIPNDTDSKFTIPNENYLSDSSSVKKTPDPDRNNRNSAIVSGYYNLK